MTHNAVRIGRVRPKTGGDIHVLAADPRTEVQQALLESALEMTDGLPDLTGYALVAWDGNGAPYCCSWTVGDSDEYEAGPVSLYLLPSFVHDALLLHILDEEAADTFCDSDV